jgi:hypothetical protein
MPLQGMLLVESRKLLPNIPAQLISGINERRLARHTLIFCRRVGDLKCGSGNGGQRRNRELVARKPDAIRANHGNFMIECIRWKSKERQKIELAVTRGPCGTDHVWAILP